MQRQDKLSKPYWNIFARELEHVLNQRRLNLELLVDHTGIDQETVRRLKHSLDTSYGLLPLLDEEEMEQVVNGLQLDQQDILRLKAAMLTTAVQRELMLYIWQDDARQAAEQIFPTIFKSLEERADERDLGNYREGDIEGAADSGLDFMLQPAWNLIDSGWEKLNQSKEVISHPIRVKRVYQACDEFTEAIDLLNRLSASIRQKRPWKHWYKEAQKGLSSAKRRLVALGE